MNSAFTLFSPQQWQVLQALSIYRFLTAEQMVKLGISTNAKSLRDKTLSVLRHHKCIHSEKLGSFLPDVHHLTKRGEDVIYELEGSIPVTAPHNKRVAFSAAFAPHRFAQVDFHIGIRTWVEDRGDADMLLAAQDFCRIADDNGRVRTPSTAMTVNGIAKPVIPDGVYAVGLITGQKALYLVEIHRSTHSKAVYEQLLRYFEVIKQQAAQQRFGFQLNPIICSVHHQDAVMRSVKARFLEHPESSAFRQNFVFRMISDLNADFSANWRFADEITANPFPKKLSA